MLGFNNKNKVFGVKKTIQKLELLDKKVRNKMIRKANHEALKPEVKQLRAIVKNLGEDKDTSFKKSEVDRSAQLAKTIGIKHKKYKKAAVAILGPRTNMRYWPLAHLLELGTAPHNIAKGAIRDEARIPKSKKATFQQPSRVIQHPGTKPNPAWKQFFESKQRIIEKQWTQSMTRLLKEGIK